MKKKEYEYDYMFDWNHKSKLSKMPLSAEEQEEDYREIL